VSLFPSKESVLTTITPITHAIISRSPISIIDVFVVKINTLALCYACNCALCMLVIVHCVCLQLCIVYACNCALCMFAIACVFSLHVERCKWGLRCERKRTSHTSCHVSYLRASRRCMCMWEGAGVDCQRIASATSHTLCRVSCTMWVRCNRLGCTRLSFSRRLLICMVQRRIPFGFDAARDGVAHVSFQIIHTPQTI